MKQTNVYFTSLLMLSLFLGIATATARPAAPGVVNIVIYVGAG
jgi:hypothetical protein